MHCKSKCCCLVDLEIRFRFTVQFQKLKCTSCLNKKKSSVIQNLPAVKSFTDGANWAYASLRKQLHGAGLPWVLSCWNAGIPYRLPCKLGAVFVYFLLEAARFASAFQKRTLPTFPALGVCWAGAERCGNAFHAGRALDFSCLGVTGFWGAQSAAPEHRAAPGPPSHGAGSRHSQAFTRASQGKELQFCAAWHFLRKLVLFFTADSRSCLGRCG